MKLTNAIREQFVANVMSDVPKPPNHAPKLEEMIVAAFVAQMPAPVQKLWKDKDHREYIARASFRGFGVHCSVPTKNVDHYKSHRLSDLPEGPAKAAIEALAEQAEAEKEAYGSLSSRLNTIAASCTTDKALAERLPEFAQYIPEQAAGAMLPATTNLITDFVKAGWPDKEKK